MSPTPEPRNYHKKGNNMTPAKLIDWSVSIVICVMILSITGIQDWIAKLFGSNYSRKELEEKVASLESRLEKLEKAHEASDAQ
jgi:hypothetical protein